MVPDPLLADYSEVLSDIILNFTLEIGYIVMIIGRKPEKKELLRRLPFLEILRRKRDASLRLRRQPDALPSAEVRRLEIARGIGKWLAGV